MSLRIVASLALIAMLGAPMVAMAEETTLKGEPVDISCFLSGRSGAGHASCATSCAEKGQPIGLFVKDGDNSQLYLVIGTHGKPAKESMAAYMGKQVSVTGEVSEQNGMKVIQVSKVME